MTIFFMPPRNSFEKNDFTQNVVRLKSIGVNTLFLTPYYFTSNPTSNRIDSTAQTIPDSQLCNAITIAQQAGIAVTLKPHIDCLDGQPRYLINPQDYSCWMEHYKSFLRKYLVIAHQFGLTSFVVATELDNIIGKKLFIDFCDSVRTAYNVNIIISTSYNNFTQSEIWKHVDMLGINAYLNLDNSDKPMESTIQETWNYWLNMINQFSELHGKPVLLTEVGFMSRSNAAKNPGDFSGDVPVDYKVQDQCYRALLSQACRFNNIEGIFFWQWELGTSGINTDKDYTPQGKPAENTIKRYWAK